MRLARQQSQQIIMVEVEEFQDLFQGASDLVIDSFRWVRRAASRESARNLSNSRRTTALRPLKESLSLFFFHGRDALASDYEEPMQGNYKIDKNFRLFNHPHSIRQGAILYYSAQNQIHSGRKRG